MSSQVKKHLCLWMACLWAVAVWGKSTVVYTRLQSFYSNADMLSIDRVALSDTATVVSFTAHGKINASFQFAPTTCLSDESGTRYALRGATGLKAGEPCYIPRSGAVEFQLVFAPMPRDTRIFDLTEGAGKGMFRILGIHDAKAKVKIPVAKEQVDSSEISENMFRKGKAVVRGKIEGYVRDWKASLVTFDINTFEQALIQPFPMSRPCAAVQDDGSFSVELELDHPVWAEMELGDGRPEVPFYVRPGDTLSVTVRGWQANNPVAEYASSHPKGCYDNLMKHQDVPVVYYEWERLTGFGQVLDEEAFLKNVDESVAENLRICDYVAWKYELSPWETHLLKNRQRLLLTEHNLLMASRLLGEKVTMPKGRTPVKEDFEGYDYSVYKVLDVLPLDDPSLSVVSRFASFPSSLNLMWPVANASMYAFFNQAFGAEESSGVRAVLEKDSLQVDALGKLAGGDGMAWGVQAFLVDKACRLPENLTPAQRTEVVGRLSARLSSSFFKRKIKELDALSRREASGVYAVPGGEARKFMAQLLDDYKGSYVQVVCLSSPEEDTGFFMHPDVENLLSDSDHDFPDVQFVAIANRDAYRPAESANGWENKPGMPRVCWIEGESYLALQELFHFSGSGKQLTFDRNGLAFRNPLNLRDETVFRQRVRRILEAEKELK